MTDTAVILAGGESRRFGRPKGLEIVGGKTLVERLAHEALSAGVKNVYISANDPEPYGDLGLKVIPDRFQDCGPLAGIHSALVETGAPSILVLACDLPGITSAEITALINSTADNPAMVVFSKTPLREHPLCAVVRSDLIGPITTALEEGKHGVLRFFHSIDHRIVEFDRERPFMNLNEPEDLKSWETDCAR